MNFIRKNFLRARKSIDVNLKNIFRQVNDTTEIFNTFLIDRNFTDEWDDENDFDDGVWIEVPLIGIKRNLNQYICMSLVNLIFKVNF